MESKWDIILFGAWLLAVVVFAILLWIVITMPDARNGLFYTAIVVLGGITVIGGAGYGYYFYKRKMNVNIDNNASDKEDLPQGTKGALRGYTEED